MDFLSEMSLFVAVVEAKSFSRAAEYLSLSVSSISRRIAVLEKKLGFKLLNRSTRSMALTEAGALYYERCAHLVAEAKLAHENLQTLLQQPQGHLRISMTSDFAIHYIAPHLPEFLAQYPKITLDIDMSPKRVAILDEHYDIALRMGPLEDSGLIAQKIGQFKRALFASPTYLNNHPRGAPQTPADLANDNCLRIGRGESQQFWTLSQNQQQEKVKINGNIISNNMRMTAELAAQGLGIALLDCTIAQCELTDNRLVQVLSDWEIAAIKVYAVTTSKLLPAKTSAFIDFYKQKLSNI